MVTVNLLKGNKTLISGKGLNQNCTGCIKRNETGFLQNSSGFKAAKYKRFQEAKIFIPDFSISELKMLKLKIV